MTLPENLIRPRKLSPGDRVGIISPASPSEKKSDVRRGMETLAEWGFEPVLGQNVNRQKGFVAATEAERAADFNEMFARDDIAAVFVTQGGYGSAQLLRLIDWANVRANPKIFTGFSDITSLHIAMQSLAGMVSFHAPGVARFPQGEVTEYTKEAFLKALTRDEPIGEIKPADPKTYLHAIGAGVAEAPLVGGNLTLICGSLGTPYAINAAGKILLMEDVDTEPWIFDHMMSHLRNAGILDAVKGIVVGECTGCEPFRCNPGFYCDTSLEDVLEYYLAPLGKPVLYGLPLGHGKDLATLPLGVRARLDADQKTLTVLESGVS